MGSNLFIRSTTAVDTRGNRPKVNLRLKSTPSSCSGVFTGIWLLICLTIPSLCLGLDPQYEADRLLMAAEAAISQGQMSEAKQHSQAAHALNTPLPAEFNYFDGLLFEYSGNHQKALNAFESYVHKSGKNGRFYKEALTAITRLKTKPPVTNSSKQDIAWGGTVDMSGRDYTQKMQALYKAPSPEEGLRRHINSLLQFYGTPEDKTKSRQFYELKIEQKNLLTFLRSDSDAQDLRVNSSQFNVYGLDPYVKTDCGKGISYTEACWVNDPRTGQPWLIIKPTKEGIAELGKAISLLIKQLQR